MEKRKPSHDLERFKVVCGDPYLAQMTQSARLSAAEIGYATGDVAALVRTMDRTMFYKSMTSFADHRRWQDVYHVPTADGMTIYLKFTDDLITEFMILSFKEK